MKTMCVFCAETVNTCAAASEHMFYVSASVWLLLETFQCFLMNVLKEKNMQLFLRIMSTQEMKTDQNKNDENVFFTSTRYFYVFLVKLL